MSSDKKFGNNNSNNSNQNQNSNNKTNEKPATHGHSSSKDWNDSEVKLLKKWGDLSASYRVLHDKAHRYYKLRNYLFTIPVIIFSTILGTASFSQDTFPEPYSSYMPMGIGTLNIISGIITTIAQFTRVSELSEANRVASISYGKFSRNIATELSLPPEFRSYTGIDFVQICRSEFDRLVEQSPTIPLDILNAFMEELEKENIKIEQPDVMKVSPIEVWQPTREEKAAKIIASAFQTMHNRSKEQPKSGVQKMAELVEKKGMNTIHKINTQIPTPSQFKETMDFGRNIINKTENDLENQIENELQNNVDHIKKVGNQFINKQIESRQNELSSMAQNNIVGKILQNNPFGSLKGFKKPSDIKKQIESKVKNEVEKQVEKQINKVKPNIQNVIEKAKKDLSQEVEETVNSIHNNVENIIEQTEKVVENLNEIEESVSVTSSKGEDNV
jgi:hypothetical protein